MTHLPQQTSRTTTDVFRFRGQPGYEAALLAAGVEPSDEHVAIATATTLGDVVDVVVRSRPMGFALRTVPFRPDHDRPLEGGALQIDVRTAVSIRVDPIAHTVRLRPGCTWPQVLEAAQVFGLAPLAPADLHGDPIAFVLGAGVGAHARRHGLASNAVSTITAVLADGEVVVASPYAEPDLFWALRGGGAGFGVVTEVQTRLIAVHEVQRVVVHWRTADVDAIVDAWTGWSGCADWAASSSFRVTPIGAGATAEVTAELTVLQDDQTGSALVERIVAGFTDAMAAGATPSAVQRSTGHGPMGASRPAERDDSDDHAGPGSCTDAAGVRDRVVAAVALGTPVVVRLLGGAIALPEQDGGAVDRIEEAFLVLPADGGAAVAGAAAPHSEAARPADGRVQRLQAVRAQLDPRGRFARDADARRSALLHGPLI